ncbi:DUF4255 domain-containing protein [Nitrosomonas sp.]|uniref:DUF4255 domain-containing protein n=1 Tax=Nitrosomonas sp. TaxID=42353 RepID=UPI00262AA0F7|nr:DUF4255 domain-containing protein [Nitrosomonas sp.]MCW5599970.1 DUF4255 domain-containing protein [Nitrosomonas sp.]
MITEAVVLIRDEVRNYLRQVKAALNAQDVLLGNIASLENQTNLTDKVIITLVNVEEESALKNSKSWSKNPLTGGIETRYPPVYLNLYLLFTATLPESVGESDTHYQRALNRIAAIVELFQSKKVFTVQNSPAFDPGELQERLLNEIQLFPELYTLTFEQINHLWGSLGGKQSPFVMYKMRVVKVQGLISAEVPSVESVDFEDNNLKNHSN